jgi:hypothetical protein
VSELDEIRDAREALLRHELELLWRHLPLDAQPAEDDDIEVGRDALGHHKIAWRPPGADVVDTLALAGWDQPEGVAAFRIRTSVDGSAVVVHAWRDRVLLDGELLRKVVPGQN